MENINNNINDLLQGLSQIEKEETLKILNEYANVGESDSLNALYNEDYEEIPVDIDTFLEDEKYCGVSTNKGTLIYPYWRDKLRDMFRDPNEYQEIALTGSIGTGKSTIACYGMVYLLYRVMCLRNPQEYYRLTKGSTIVFAFFNNTLDLSTSVGYNTVQKILQDSPWFMERGMLSGTKNIEYIPNKLIRFRVGSTASHALGANIMCLDGDTKIVTENGIEKIKDLENKIVSVYSINDNGDIVLSNKCKILQSGITDELYNIELDNGEIIKCTAEHRFMLNDGTYKSAKDLTENDELLCLALSNTIIIKSISKIKLNEPLSVYDVVDAIPHNNFLISVGDTYIVSHNCSMLDEVSFKQGANVVMEKSKIMETYNNVLERMGSRFMVDGKIAGKLFLVSSKKSEYDFLESYIRKQKDKQGVYVVDAKLWEVKPEQTYSGKMFNVAIGGNTRSSRIIREDEDVNEYMRQGYEVLEVPIEFKHRFELDIQSALMNIAGISISHTTRFIAYDNLARCYNNYKNPFTTNILTIGMYDNLNIKDFFIPDMVDNNISSRPIFIHIDTSLTGDRTGISAIAIMGYKNVNEYSLDSGEMETTKELYYHHIFTVGIQCPTSSEISFQKTRDFIYYLRYNLGWNIKGISLDGYQSLDTRQQLITMGFVNTDIVSLDKTPNGYFSYKSAINEQRVSHLNIPELEFEIINLARDNMTGKIDHDIDKCFTGDTKIKLVDGRDLTILELLQEQNDNKTNWVYTFNETTQKIEPKRIKKVFQTMLTKNLVKVTLDNGEYVTCTPNHRFMLRNGSYEIASNLVNGMSLMSLSNNIMVDNIKHFETYCNVYDLEIEDNHNFALFCGVIVHNSKDLSDSLAGAIYNASISEQDLDLYLIDSHEIALDTNEGISEDVVQKENILESLIDKSSYTPPETLGKNDIDDIITNEDDDGFFFM